MKHKRLNFLLLLIFLCLFFHAHFVSAQTADPPANPVKTNEEDLIHFGDLIDVDVLGSYDFDWRGKISPEGFLENTDYFETPVYGLCRSEEDVATSLEKAYSKLLKDPKVVVKIIDRSNRRTAELYGAVKTPQRFQIRRPVFLNELLILSGGLTEQASGEIQIFRPTNLNCEERENLSETAESEKSTEKKPPVDSEIIKIKVSDLLKGEKEFNPKILNGDIVTILSAEPVYIIGGVQNPKQISLRSSLTLTRAIDSAGGLSKNAVRQEVTIFRKDGQETKIIEADLEKIKINPADDLVLKAYDIIEIGQKGGRKRKYPPVIQEKDATKRDISNLPLRIID